VLISNYLEFYRLTSYFRRYTKQMVGVTMGINNLLEVFNEKYYANLDGGLLESFGRLFKNQIKLYVYPMRQSAYDRYCSANPTACAIPSLGTSATDVWVNAINLQVQPHLRNLYAHLLENHYLAPIVGYDSSIMEIFSRDVLNSIKNGTPGWEKMLPDKAAATIKERRLFGYKEPEVAKLEPVA
jgi:hypothetical protein